MTTRSASSSGSELPRERLAIRCSAIQKEHIQRAAAIRGETVSEFMLRVSADAAWQTIREDQVITLSERDTEALFNAVLNPPEPNEHLRKAVERYIAMQRGA